MKTLPRFAPIIAILALLLLVAIGGSALANNNAVPEVDADTATVQMYSPIPSGTETTGRSETSSPTPATGDPVPATEDGVSGPTGTQPELPTQFPAQAPAPVQAPNPSPAPQVPLDYQYWDDDWDDDDDVDDSWDDDGDDGDWDDD